jgi:DNA-directed RNA polymerase subunit RPC12/RpoP
MTLKLIAAKCPNCAAALHVKPTQLSVRCEYCGGDVLIRPSKPVRLDPGSGAEHEAFARAERLLIAGNYKKARESFKKWIAQDAEDGRAWLGLARSTALQTTVAHDGLSESLPLFQRAFSLLPDDPSDAWIRQVAQALTEAATWQFDLTRQYFDEFVENQPSFERAQEEYLRRLRQVVGALEEALLHVPDEPDILRALVRVCLVHAEDLIYSGPDRYRTHDDVRLDMPDAFRRELKFKYSEYRSRLQQLGAGRGTPPANPAFRRHRVKSGQEQERDRGVTVLNGLLAFFATGALAALVVLVLGPGGPGPTGITGDGQVVIKRPSVPLLAEPRVEARVLAELSAGTRLRAWAQGDGDWFLVQSGAQQGFVRLEDIQAEQAEDSLRNPGFWITVALAGFFICGLVRVTAFSRKSRK